jgi:hypothetical protein
MAKTKGKSGPGPCHKFGIGNSKNKNEQYCPASDLQEQGFRRRDAEEGSAELLRRLYAEHGEPHGRKNLPI